MKICCSGVQFSESGSFSLASTEQSQMPSFTSSKRHSHSSLHSQAQFFILEKIFANFSLHKRQSVTMVAPIIINAPMCIPIRQAHEDLLFEFFDIRNSFRFFF